jgi:S-formylglutathione hydrolase FrmB
MPAWNDELIKDRNAGGDSPYRILLPPDYQDGSRSYPTLYLLHGLFGSFENWTELAKLEPVSNLIIVMPEGGDGWYCDTADGGEMHETRIVADLVPEIDTRYRTIATREARSIAGNSMGGYGALKIALKFPELFGFTASFSGAFEAANWDDQFPPSENWDEYRPSRTRIFESAGSRTRSENDLYRLAAGTTGTGVPYIFFDCGITDPFLDANRRLAYALRASGAEHEFRILPGGHEWDYWATRGKFLTGLISERSLV